MVPCAHGDDRDRQIRCILVRMILDIRALFVARKRPTEETLVQLAIQLGEYEDKPVNASEISHIIKIPRTSVIRHVDALVAQGRVRVEKDGRRMIIRPPEIDFPETKLFYREAERTVARVCSELSKMDTLAARHKE
ncbi:winged helix-turn-helix domain-containing protein [Brucella endophytica]|uniref:winged helix-turn-helix domain-containing protein n=1 Tax=Brucella endophytica TaxID=1963359 RepID=UPI00166774A1|nr:winged helix-turn-helix domain-containing protein [Brucella endophytica]